MGQSITIVTDSLACLTPELARQYNIYVVPLSFMLKGKVYRDWVDISPSRAYELFLEDPDSFQSSAPSPEDFSSVFREAGRKTPNVLCISLSSKLSATYNIAVLAAAELKQELPDVHFEFIDALTTTAAEGLIVIAGARAAADGCDFPDVVRTAREVAARVKFFAMLDTIRHVYRSGRVPKIASQIGSVLHVKPILSITPETNGTVHFDGIARTRQNGVERVLKIMQSEVGRQPVHVAVMHAYALEEAQKLKAMTAAMFNCQDIWLTEFSPLMGYATGTGTLGIAYYAEP